MNSVSAEHAEDVPCVVHGRTVSAVVCRECAGVYGWGDADVRYWSVGSGVEPVYDVA